MTEQTPLAILKGHEFEIDVEDGNHICTCGTWKEVDCIGTYEAYLAHVAQVLDQHIRLREEQAKAEALLEAASGLERGIPEAKSTQEWLRDLANRYKAQP